MNPRTVSYVLRSFPEPSETFIADEALSIVDIGIDVHILYLHEGQREVVHPSARRLLDRGKVKRLSVVSRWQMFGALLKLFGASKKRTWVTLLNALRSESRWCYFQALPTAVWCLEHSIEYLHAHFADTNFLYARTLSDWTGIPYGVTTHRYDIFENPVAFPVTVDLLQQASIVVTISEFNRLYMTEKYALAYDRIVLVHCGIDLTRFPYAPRQAVVPGQKLHLLNIGRLVDEKGQDVLLHAMRILRDRGVLFQLDIIGGGPKLDELLRLRSELNLNDLVTFHGAKSEAFVREQLQVADMFVLSSRSEGLPIVCIEAMASGALLIATRITGIPELVVSGVNGLLVHPDDPVGLADAICSAHSDLRAIEHMRVSARQSVEIGFERKQCTEQLIAKWQSIFKTDAA